jgi:serine/threonine protein kinase
MFLPTRVEISNAVKYPQFIKDPFFEDYSIAHKQSGGIQEWAGGFSMVYCMIKDNEKWAFKVWHTEIGNIKERYQKISAYLTKINLPYFSNFSYIENGLLVTDLQLNTSQLIDTFRMKWVEGTNLAEYISMHLHDKNILEKLAEDFLTMIRDFHKSGISHGDFKNENIFVTTTGEIKLIDYDSICVPEIEGQKDICRGSYGFQHPSRITAGIISSLKIDYFSELIIYLSIIAVSENPVLWDKYKVVEADSRLLFTPEDFLAWENSAIKIDLNLLSEKVNNLVGILEGYLASHLLLQPLS